MASSAALKRAAPRENVHTDIGLVGRKTGFTVAGLSRNDDGMENMSDFFSSPRAGSEAPPPRSDEGDSDVDEDAEGEVTNSDIELVKTDNRDAGDYDDTDADTDADVDLEAEDLNQVSAPRQKVDSAQPTRKPDSIVGSDSMDIEASSARSIKATLESRRLDRFASDHAYPGLASPAKRRSSVNPRQVLNRTPSRSAPLVHDLATPLLSVSPRRPPPGVRPIQQKQVTLPTYSSQSKSVESASSKENAAPRPRRSEQEHRESAHPSNPISIRSSLVQKDKPPTNPSVQRSLGPAQKSRVAASRSSLQAVTKFRSNISQEEDEDYGSEDEDQGTDIAEVEVDQSRTAKFKKSRLASKPASRNKTTQKTGDGPQMTDSYPVISPHTDNSKKRGRKPKKPLNGDHAPVINDDRGQDENAVSEAESHLSSSEPDLGETEQQSAQTSQYRQAQPPTERLSQHPKEMISPSDGIKRRGRPRKTSDKDNQDQSETANAAKGKRILLVGGATVNDALRFENTPDAPVASGNETPPKRGRKRKLVEAPIPLPNNDPTSSNLVQPKSRVKKHKPNPDEREPLKNVANVAAQPSSSVPCEDSRPKRSRIAPLQFWKNEKRVYTVTSRGESGAAVSIDEQILRVADTPVAVKKRRKTRARHTLSVELAKESNKTTNKKGYRKKLGNAGQDTSDEDDDHQEDEEDEDWEKVGKLVGMVKTWPPAGGDGEPEIEDEIATSRSGIEFKPIFGSDYLFAKTLGTEFMGCGILELGSGAAKKVKSSGKMQLVFFIIQGKIEAEVNELGFRIGKGGQFQVPRGNMYKISNPFKRTARLFFSQACIPDTAEG